MSEQTPEEERTEKRRKRLVRNKVLWNRGILKEPKSLKERAEEQEQEDEDQEVG